MGGRTAYDAIQAHLDGKKTPYHLDLEVKDRKPSIIPKVGDKVKIKSREWYEKWKDECGYVNVPELFTPPMAGFCGKVLTVEDFRSGRFLMKEDVCKWTFSPEMFEDVYPVQEQIVSQSPRIDFTFPSLFQPSSGVKEDELLLSKEELGRLKKQIRESWWGIKSKYAKGILDILPHCSKREQELLEKGSDFAANLNDTENRLTAYTLVQCMTAKTKFKQIRTTHLITLKKL